MIATVFVDESYGDGPRLLVGGLVSSWHKWMGFSAEWRQMLVSANVPYAHYLEMDRNKGPFPRQQWGVVRKTRFLRTQREILQRWVTIGLTVTIDQELYRKVYRPNFPVRCSPDSAYGLAAKELILMAQRHCSDYFEEVDAINFVWEEGHQNLPNVEQIFRDLKVCYGERARTLGAFIRASRLSAPALQAVDQLTVAARQSEAVAKAKGMFGEVPRGVDLDTVMAMLEPGEHFPVFYHELTAERLQWHRDNAAEMGLFKRKAARARG